MLTKCFAKHLFTVDKQIAHIINCKLINIANKLLYHLQSWTMFWILNSCGNIICMLALQTYWLMEILSHSEPESHCKGVIVIKTSSTTRLTTCFNFGSCRLRATRLTLIVCPIRVWCSFCSVERCHRPHIGTDGYVLQRAKIYLFTGLYDNIDIHARTLIGMCHIVVLF